MIDGGLLTTVTAESVHFAAISELDAAREELLRVTNVFETGEEVHDQESLFRVLADTLRFPDWFGGNWDALEDCLGDLSWRPGNGHVLVFRNWQALTSDDLGVLIDVLRSSAESWSGRGRPFFAVLIDPQARLALPPLHRE